MENPACLEWEGWRPPRSVQPRSLRASCMSQPGLRCSSFCFSFSKMMGTTWSIWKHFHTASYSEGEKRDLQILSNERGISKCYHDVQTHPCVSEVSCRCFALFAFFVQILVAATEQDEEVRAAHPASHGFRQTGRPSSAAVSVCSASSLRVVSLSSSNHVVQAAGYQKKRLQEHSCRQDDT